MKFRCGSSLLFTLSFVCCFGLLSAPRAWGQKKAATTETTAKPNASERKTETFEDLTEHFEGDTDKRGFPMNLFPAGTQGGLVWAALGAGALGGLLAAGGGSIAMVNYESQTSPQSKPDERLAARSAGRVGLGVFGLGALLMFAPPLLIDWALPAPTDVPNNNSSKAPRQSCQKNYNKCKHI